MSFQVSQIPKYEKWKLPNMTVENLCHLKDIISSWPQRVNERFVAIYRQARGNFKAIHQYFAVLNGGRVGRESRLHVVGKRF